MSARRRAISQPTPASDGPSFEELGLGPEVLEAVRRAGFEHPTPIQAAVIPHALAGRDVIGLAETGSGKTAAFGLPIVQQTRPGGGPRALILSPTREIALQTEEFLDLFAGGRKELSAACLIGGLRIGPQIDKLRRGADLIVATPGRLLDHARRRTLKLDSIEKLVIDEADRMLDMGFLPQIQEILVALPRRRQTMIFSATMPPPIDRLARRIMREPVSVDLRPRGGAAEGIRHRLYLVDPKDKKECLLALAREEKGSMLVFLRRKTDGEWACRQLELEGHPVERIHSDRTQKQRLAALAGFREGEHRILVATDIAARGLDIPRIEHIVNFDLPESAQIYIHRAGRTARGTAKGLVSSIATWQDKPTIREIEKELGQQLPRCTATGVEPYKEEGPTETRSRLRARKKIRRRLL